MADALNSRRGDGPGETFRPVEVAVAPDARIAIWDLGRSAALFGPDGAYLRTELDRTRAVASSDELLACGQLGWLG